MGAKASFLSTANSQPNGSGGAKYQDWYGISRNVSWCAAFVCYVANKSGCGNIVPKTSSCTDMIGKFKQMGCYTEYNCMRTNTNRTPVPGDIIFFDWDKSGDADHVAIVTAVSGGSVTIKEGNFSNAVNTRQVLIKQSGSGQGNPTYGSFVRGWATPKFSGIDSGSTEATSTTVNGEGSSSSGGLGGSVASILSEEDIGWVPDFDEIYDQYKDKYTSNGTRTAITGDDLNELREMNNLRGIHGLPPGFLSTADPRLTFAEIDSQDGEIDLSKVFNTKVLGSDYMSSIATKMPLLYITPCEPVFLPAMSSNQEKREKMKTVLQTMVGTLSESLNEMMGDYSGKLYSTQPAYADYFKYVNPMCRSMAIFLNLEKIPAYSAACNILHPYTFNWGRNYMSESDMEDIFKDSDNKKYMKESVNDKFNAFQRFVFHRAMIPFYVNAEPTIQEEFSNETTNSTLSSQINGLSDQARELQFILGMTTSQVGLNFDKLKDTIGDSKQILDDFVSSLPIGGNVFSSLVNSLNTVIAGGKIIFPEIWSDSDFSRSYTVNTKLISPSADSFSIWRHILVPLAHIWALVCPRQSDKNGYSAPFLVKAFMKGMFNVEMGIITSVSVTKGKENTWNKDGLPTVVDVSITIKDLYKTLSITSMDNIKFDTMNNMAEMDFLANACGVNFDVPDTARYLQMFMTLNFKDRAIDLFGDAGNIVTNWGMTKFMGIRTALRGVRGI